MRLAMPGHEHQRIRSTTFGRREFLTGTWAGGAEIASALVQARPERLAEVERAISAIDGVEIHGRDERGKIVVVIEAPDSGAIGATLNSISLLPDVLSAALVYHAIDAG
jgi:nitrate reductase NapD